MNCPCPFQLRERERGRSDGPNTVPGSCARDWIHRIQKKKYRRRKRKRPLLPLRRTAERDSRGDKHQYNLSSDQHSHCPRRSVCVRACVFSRHTVSTRLFCFYRRLDFCNYFWGALPLIDHRTILRDIYSLSCNIFLVRASVRILLSFFVAFFYYYGQYSYSDGLSVPPTLVHRE